jgi:uncharacterized sodium:solute symporter family permease YidK
MSYMTREQAEHANAIEDTFPGIGSYVGAALIPILGIIVVTAPGAYS